MKEYLETDVWTEFNNRLKIIFENFDNIYVAFSGGKDSGVLLQSVIKYIRDNNLNRKIGVFHQDFEAEFDETTDFVNRMMQSNPDIIEPVHVCLPMSVSCATSMYQSRWYPWDQTLKEKWCKPLPDFPYVFNLENHDFDFYYDGISQEEIYKNFSLWYHKKKKAKKTVCLLGIRTDESLNRFRAVSNQSKHTFRDLRWTTDNLDDTYIAYPMYDWAVSDVWKATYDFDFDYNRTYDLMHYAGLTPAQMRIASPFNDSAIQTLNLYRVIEPKKWIKLLDRVEGSNFTALYTGTQMASSNISLPEGYTWKEYVEFLLNTLPPESAKSYKAKFEKSIKFWKETGGVIDNDVLEELSNQGIVWKESEQKRKGRVLPNKTQVVFPVYPDDCTVSKDYLTVPTYKRMAICIMKNDSVCKTMGYALTSEEAEKRKAALDKYKGLKQ